MTWSFGPGRPSLAAGASLSFKETPRRPRAALVMPVRFSFEIDRLRQHRGYLLRARGVTSRQLPDRRRGGARQNSQSVPPVHFVQSRTGNEGPIISHFDIAHINQRPEVVGARRAQFE